MATAPKKRRSAKTRARANGGMTPPPAPAPDMEMIAFGTGDPADINMADSAIEIPTDDGHVVIQFGEPEKPRKPSDFDDNLAEEIDPFELGRIGEALLEAIDQDDRDRSEWLQQRADGLDLLGQKVEKPGTGNVGSSSTAVAGQSSVRDSILSEACDQFQANAFAELCPAQGPCKVVNYGDETDQSDQLAEELEKDFNYYLTSIAKEYYPDTRRMLWWTGYASGTFKKVYKCPLRRRPVSESVDGADLIIPSNATDLHNAGRITHRIDMRQSTMKRMQLLGVYRDVPLQQPTPQPNALMQKEGSITGITSSNQRPEDQEYTVYECYCELDIPGFEHKEDGAPSGLPLPYRVTIDKDSRTILEIRRNWREEDDDFKAKIPFVLFPYGTGLSIYGTGLLQRLGNYTVALTAMLRESIDAGMFASFPGFLYAKPAGRQLQSEFRVPPGGGAPIDVSAVGNDITKAVMPLPYKDVSTAMVALMAQTRENAFRYANMANTGVAEGKQNAPVGTTLAMIEQATQVMGGVHKALHAAQAEEMALFKELFRDDPEALWRGNRRPALGAISGKQPNETPEQYEARLEAARAARLAKFQQALENCELEPRTDPNVPSRMHRLAKANTLIQLATTIPIFKLPDVVMRWARMIDIDDIESLLAPPGQGPSPEQQLMFAKIAIEKQNADTKQASVMLKAQADKAKLESQQEVEAAKIAFGQKPETGKPQRDPYKEMDLAIKQQGQDLQAAKLAFDAQNAQADRDSREAVEAFKFATTAGVHPESAGIMDQQMAKVAEFLQPAAEKRAADGGPVSGAGGAANEKWPDVISDLLVDGSAAPNERELEDAHRQKISSEITRALQELAGSGKAVH